MSVTAASVGELRQETGCSLMECKKALVDASGDFETAKTLLRERLGDIGNSAKPTTEGTLAVGTNVRDGKRVYSIVQIGTETDFAANSEEVRATAGFIAAENIIGVEIDAEAMVADLRAKTKENVRLVLNYISDDYVAGADNLAFYLHHDRKTAAVVAFKGQIDDETAKKVAMHLAAAEPEAMAISIDCYDRNPVLYEKMLAKERDFLTSKAQASGKPPEIQAKIVDGGMKKFKEANAFLSQPFIMDPKKKVKDIIGSAEIIKIHKVVVGR